MFHWNTERMIDYWRGLRRGPGAPARADIDPTAFADLLAHAFVVAWEDGDYRFRLAGEAVNDLQGRSLAGVALPALWRPAHRRHLVSMLAAALRDAQPLVIGAEARIEAAAQPRRLELLFAPVTGGDGGADRFLGLVQPLSGRDAGRAGELAIRSVDGVNGRPAPAPLRLAALDGRRIA
jgi:hypothetical protein